MTKGILKNALTDDKIEEISIAALYQFKYEDYNICSYEPKFETLNLVLADRNKLICEQESKLTQLDKLVESLHRQFQSHRIKERKLEKELGEYKDLAYKLQKENNILRAKQSTCRASYSGQNKSSNSIYLKKEKDFPPNSKICFSFCDHGFCKWKTNCKYSTDQ